MPANAINVARPGKWGNPFVVGRDGTRAQCVAKFVVLQQGFIALGDTVDPEVQLAMWQRLRSLHSIEQLRGKDLACWCPLDSAPCHADVLLHLANGSPLPGWAIQPIELPRVRLGMAASDFLKLKRASRKAAEVTT